MASNTLHGVSNEEIKEAVLAECKRLAPTQNETTTLINGLHLIRFGLSWEFSRYHSIIASIRAERIASDSVWGVAYRLLGLGERRLAEESEALREKARLYDEAEGVLGKMIEILKRKREQVGQTKSVRVGWHCNKTNVCILLGSGYKVFKSANGWWVAELRDEGGNLIKIVSKDGEEQFRSKELAMMACEGDIKGVSQ